MFVSGHTSDSNVAQYPLGRGDDQYTLSGHTPDVKSSAGMLGSREAQPRADLSHPGISPPSEWEKATEKIDGFILPYQNEMAPSGEIYTTNLPAKQEPSQPGWTVPKIPPIMEPEKQPARVHEQPTEFVSHHKTSTVPKIVPDLIDTLPPAAEQARDIVRQLLPDYKHASPNDVANVLKILRGSGMIDKDCVAMCEAMGIPRTVVSQASAMVLLPTDAQTLQPSSVKESVAAMIPWWKRPSFGEVLTPGNQHGQ